MSRKSREKLQAEEFLALWPKLSTDIPSFCRVFTACLECQPPLTNLEECARVVSERVGQMGAKADLNDQSDVLTALIGTLNAVEFKRLLSAIERSI